MFCTITPRNPLWFVVLWLFLSPSNAVSQTYSFSQYSYEDGMPEFAINTATIGPKGCLWLGTAGGGLYRFDGYGFKSYNRENGLPAHKIYALSLSADSLLWLATDAGVLVYNGQSFNTPEAFLQLEDLQITTLVADNTGGIWAASQKGQLFHYQHGLLRSIEDSIQGSVTTLYLAKGKELWIGTDTGAYRYAQDTLQAITQQAGIEAHILAFTQSSDGNIWLGTNNKGVYRYNGASLLNYNRYDGLSSNQVMALWANGAGKVWLGTQLGIDCIEGLSIENYRKGTGQGPGGVTAIVESNNGALWFATNGGNLFRYNGTLFRHYPPNDYLGNEAYAIIQASNKNMVFATNKGGITVFDGQRYNLSKDPARFTTKPVKALYYMPDGTLWVGTSGDGAFRFDKGYKKYKSVPGMGSNHIIGFAHDKLGRIWMATPNHGVSVCNYQDSVAQFQNYSAHPDSLGSNQATAIHAGPLGNIWVGTADAGLYRINIPAHDSIPVSISHQPFTPSLDKVNVQCITTDSLGTMYIGTAGEGLLVKHDSILVQITKEQGLHSDNVYALSIDDAGFLWAGTGRGVHQIRLDRHFQVSSMLHFGKQDGFYGKEVYRNAIFKDTKGHLWFGTVSGIMECKPDKVPTSPTPPRTHITQARLFFDNLANTPYADTLTGWYPLPQNLVLPYHQNNLTFAFKAVSLGNANRLEYKWQLLGLGQDWSPALKRREAVFSNLPPGEFTFMAMARNNQGAWGPAATYTFTILPPFWQQSWFIVSTTIVLALILWGGFAAVIGRIRRKNKAIHEKLEMEKNILELEQEAARLQMNPHFIFNSLNSIQGFIGTNEPFQAKRYLAKFAKLMRLILENAREEFIPLANEIEILKNYLELEQLSANHQFEYTIELIDELEPESAEIPPMLVQPFVENAILHGVKKKKGPGRITITFEAKGEMAICCVSDDGVGRTADAQAQSKASGHKSTGISVTKKRLAQYQAQRELPFGIAIADLYPGQTNPGTMVTVTMPLESY